MSTASSAIQDSRNFAATQAGNVPRVDLGVFNNLITDLMDGTDISLPTWTPDPIKSQGPVNIGAAPTFNASYVEPTGAPVAPDIRSIMEQAYNSANPVTVAALTAAIDSWLSLYAPEYKAALAALEVQITNGITGTAITDAVEEAMYTRLITRIENEARGNQRQVANQMKKRGYEMPQIVFSAEINRINQDASDRTAAAATEVYVERFKMELQHKQFCMNLSAQIRQAMQSAFLEFAGIVATLKQHAIQYATAVADAAAKTYQAEVAVFETRLKAALSAFQAAVDRNKAEIEVFTTNIQAQIDSKRLEYDRMKMQLEANQIPFEAGVKEKLAEAELNLNGLKAAADVLSAANAAAAQVASAAMSSISGIASTAAEE